MSLTGCVFDDTKVSENGDKTIQGQHVGLFPQKFFDIVDSSLFRPYPYP
jgi:hypothetical protein